MSATRYIVEIGGVKREVSVELCGQRWELTVDGQVHRVEQAIIEKDRHYSLIVGDDSYLVDLVETDWRQGRFVVNAIAEQIEVKVRDELESVADEVTAAKGDAGLFDLKSPMPGIVVRLLAAPGERVARGQGLVVLEAMKMQNELASGMDGIVQEILVKDGEIVETGALLARVIKEEG